MTVLSPVHLADEIYAPGVEPPPLPPPPAAPTPADAFLAAFAARHDDAIPGAPPLAVADDGWQDTTPSPWRRYLARQLDVLVLGTLAWGAAGIVVAAISGALFDRLFAPEIVENRLVSLLVTYASVVPILAVFIGFSGTSPGKWLMGVRVVRRDGAPIGLVAGVQRELAIWVKGFGLAVPLVSLITLVASYRRLKDHGVASWDEGTPWVVTHRPPGALQATLFVLGVVGYVGLSLALESL